MGFGQAKPGLEWKACAAILFILAWRTWVLAEPSLQGGRQCTGSNCNGVASRTPTTGSFRNHGPKSSKHNLRGLGPIPVAPMGLALHNNMGGWPEEVTTSDQSSVAAISLSWMSALALHGNLIALIGKLTDHVSTGVAWPWLPL